MNWYERHFKNPELVVCKRCCSIFYSNEASGRKECPKCKYDVNKEDGDRESMNRIKDKMR